MALLQPPPLPPIELYDHEVIEIQKIWATLRDRHQKAYRNYNDVEREIKERFAESGFIVHVNWYGWMIDGKTQEGVCPEITITGRTETHAFDHDRQVHEVTRNVLEIPGEEGVIKTDPDTLKRFMEGQGGHGHDHGHGH